jgi:hypothetical protein
LEEFAFSARGDPGGENICWMPISESILYFLKIINGQLLKQRAVRPGFAFRHCLEVIRIVYVFLKKLSHHIRHTGETLPIGEPLVFQSFLPQCNFQHFGSSPEICDNLFQALSNSFQFFDLGLHL